MKYPFLFVTALIFGPLAAQGSYHNEEECCYKKTITGPYEFMNGVYVLAQHKGGMKPAKCDSKCVYSKQGAHSGKQYCFNPSQYVRANCEQDLEGVALFFYGSIGKSLQRFYSGIETSDGRVKGSVHWTPSGTSYTAFYGIPYAAPPVGVRRFLPPQSPQPWHGVLDVSKEDTTKGCIHINVFNKTVRILSPDFPDVVVM